MDEKDFETNFFAIMDNGTASDLKRYLFDYVKIVIKFVSQKINVHGLNEKIKNDILLEVKHEICSINLDRYMYEEYVDKLCVVLDFSGCLNVRSRNIPLIWRIINLKWFKLLTEYNIRGCDEEAMDLAAGRGHLEVVKWLDENRREGCSTAAMDLAAMNGHLNVVKWLSENRREGCTTKALDYAALNGHLEIVKWLIENRTEGSIQRAMSRAIEGGHSKVVEYLKKISLK